VDDNSTTIALPEGGYLFLAGMSEPSNNDLRVVVVLGRANETAVETEIGPAFPVVTDDASRAFELIWWNYVAYAVRNESWAIPDEAQVIGASRFGYKTISAFLAYVAASSWATDEHPGKLTHWYLNTEWHCLDVVSVAPPEMRELTMEQARAEAAKLVAQGGDSIYAANRPGAPSQE
jgi:hypothetical protein